MNATDNEVNGNKKIPMEHNSGKQMATTSSTNSDNSVDVTIQVNSTAEQL